MMIFPELLRQITETKVNFHVRMHFFWRITIIDPDFIYNKSMLLFSHTNYQYFIIKFVSDNPSGSVLTLQKDSVTDDFLDSHHDFMEDNDLNTDTDEDDHFSDYQDSTEGQRNF